MAQQRPQGQPLSVPCCPYVCVELEVIVEAFGMGVPECKGDLLGLDASLSQLRAGVGGGTILEGVSIVPVEHTGPTSNYISKSVK